MVTRTRYIADFCAGEEVLKSHNLDCSTSKVARRFAERYLVPGYKLICPDADLLVISALGLWDAESGRYNSYKIIEVYDLRTGKRKER